MSDRHLPAPSGSSSAPTLTFLGGVGTVTGSRFLVETAGARVLVEAGLFQGPKPLRLLNREPFPVDPATIDAIVLTHAHLDHTGYLPALVRAGFTGPVLATANTMALTRIVLEDSARLQEEEAAYANRKGYSKHHPATALYTVEDAHQAFALLEPLPDAGHVAVAGLKVARRSAGHILGSSSVVLELPHGERLLVSGDLGRSTHPILRSPAPRQEADVVLVESTYGNRRHEPMERGLERLAHVITATARRGGVVVIPAFAVDRTEVVLHALATLRRSGAIPELPVHVDSPMALAVLEVYRQAIRRGDPECRIRPGDPDPFDAGQVHEARSPAESRALNDLDYPSIIISSSGMATGGRVLHHLAARIGDPHNTVVLAGYQAVGTRGRALADGARVVKIHGRYLPVRADVETIDAFSVHADADELTRWLHTGPPPRTTFVVHGETDASEAIRRRLTDDLQWTAAVPRLGERVRLD